jgi:hypothetical protein
MGGVFAEMEVVRDSLERARGNVCQFVHNTSDMVSGGRCGASDALAHGKAFEEMVGDW